MQHFEGFDPEGYSIYFVDYKYPEENTVNFIVMNKVPPFAVAPGPGTLKHADLVVLTFSSSGICWQTILVNVNTPWPDLHARLSLICLAIPETLGGNRKKTVRTCENKSVPPTPL